jgi:hypothetical protein
LYSSFVAKADVSISGGGNMPNLDLNRFGPALRWMTYEAINNGLRMSPFTEQWEEPKLNESLVGVWKVLEYMPFGRLSYAGKNDTTYRLVVRSKLVKQHG